VVADAPDRATPQKSELRVNIRIASNLPEIERLWLDLQERSDCSYFQSWGWIGSWLQAVLPHQAPQLLEVTCEGRVVALGMLGRHDILRRGIVRSRQLYVAETGNPAIDALTVEHNGFLIERGLGSAVLPAVIRALKQSQTAWDELVVSGVDDPQAAAYLDAARATGLTGSIRWHKPYYLVTAEDVRAHGGDYLATLSGNSRYQIRRALREYARHGEVTLTVAGDVTEAEEFFMGLVELHQRYWRSRGQPGAFGSNFALDYHRALVRARFPHGEIQLLRVTAGSETLGYLYNFSFRDAVSSYQSGLHYTPDPKLKPGLVSHCLAIQRNLEQGAQAYDLLMGQQQYKEMLATRQAQMAWLLLQRGRVRFRVESALVALSRGLRASRSSPQRANPIQ
jgi:CelD/BcsL family acetyltransferase involved in cellulose biosynthesis